MSAERPFPSSCSTLTPDAPAYAIEPATAATNSPGGGEHRVMATRAGADGEDKADQIAAGAAGGSSHLSKRKVCSLQHTQK